ncbi:MAG: peptidoglycan bridge formation glycyltransferase FemA/FemB family protein [Candidatus Uhrbacteria bacterium]
MDLLQSEAWEQFQQALGHRTHRVGGVLCIAMPLPFGGTYLYSPRMATSDCGLQTTAFVQELSKQIRAVFWRAEFPTPPNPPSQREEGEKNWEFVAPRVMRRLVEPRYTWRTSLEPSCEDMMAAMHEKHRYNIRLAERRGVTIRTSNKEQGTENNEDLEVFWKLLQETASRQKIHTHARSYYETMLASFRQRTTDDGLRQERGTADCSLYLAEREGVPLATAFVVYYGDTATYLHGGSSYGERKHMAPHLLHWTAMQDAKAVGMRWYDWGGVEDPGSSDHRQASSTSWSGMTRFKHGFGGEMVTHPPTQDLILRPARYTALAALARLRT